MIRKLKSGEYRLYSRKADPKTRKRRNLEPLSPVRPRKNMRRKYNILKDTEEA